MIKDFTLDKYRELLQALDDCNQVILRHDVDKKPKNSLATAFIEREMGWKATYYFRVVPESYDPSIILQIASLGHEIGYHYESLATCRGDMEAAYRDFCDNLEKIRSLVPVKTIAMHGSPRSKWNSLDLWKLYDYHKLGIETEPYLDTDFSKVVYLTDTGRRWDGYRVSVRDKIPAYQEQWCQRGWCFRSTDDIIQAIGQGAFPNDVMINTHPQRWTDNKVQWLKELVTQSVKNVVKRVVINKKM